MDLRSLSWTLSVIFVSNFGRFEAQFPVPLSRGDLILTSNKLLVISMAPDGVQNATKYLYYVSGEQPSLPDSVGNVVARQLGYSFCEITYPVTANAEFDFPCLGMKGFKCKTWTSHILRCSYNSIPGACKLLVRADCSNDYSYRMGTINGIKLGNLGYSGQVLLYPPAVPEGLVFQASVGIVMVKEEFKGEQYWRHILKGNQSVSESVANTFCRQMGYTHVNPSSIMTRSEAEYLYGYDFSIWDSFSPTKIDVAEIDCSKSSQRCLGCCHYPPPGASDLSTGDDVYPDALVIRCTFSPFFETPPLGGNEDVCAFHDDFKLKGKKICDMDEKISLEERAFVAAMAVPSGVLLLICVALAVCLILVLIRCRCRCWPARPARELGGQDDYQHVPDEQPND